MKRKHLLRLLGLVLSAALTIAALSPPERAGTGQPDWMGRLSDDTPLGSLTIPGTHDSGALYSFAGVSGKCQSVSVKHQLNMGVRFLDIRLKLDHNELKIVHSFVDQKQTLAEVLEEIVSFIRANPSEFLLVSFKEDASPSASDVEFSAKLEEMLLCHDVIVPDSALPPVLGDARGKIFVLSRYADASLGISAQHGWQDSASFPLGSLYVQDHYAVSDPADKQQDILAAVQEAVSGNHALVLNYTSCYLDHGFPPMSAAVPARTLHPWLLDFCRTADACAGVFICDFMTSELACALIERNFS